MVELKRSRPTPADRLLQAAALAGLVDRGQRGIRWILIKIGVLAEDEPKDPEFVFRDEPTSFFSVPCTTGFEHGAF